ncbi:hypothetical protein QBC41DRAFT_300572 [Cercophora samala]|uniref:Uncharacterized protein n=1 Tax=Cercophora samala TaxID=330535 RepID=A0AA40DF72_9PEZI|nr:hypothetical protein QBC41DRAFT_300572 [Cercophora samala]
MNTAASPQPGTATDADIEVRSARARDIDAIYQLNLQQYFESPVWNHVFQGLSTERSEHCFYKEFESLIKEHIKYSIYDYRCFYLVAQIFNTSTNKQEIIASACFEWITNHHTTRNPSRAHIAHDRVHKVHSTLLDNIAKSHLEHKQDAEIRKSWETANPGIPISGYQDNYSTIADFFSTYHTRPSQPNIPQLPRPISERLPHVTQHFTTLEIQTLIPVLGTKKPKYATFSHLLDADLTYPGLWSCTSLAISPSTPHRQPAISHLLSWIHDAASLPLRSPPNNSPPGPDPICLCFPTGHPALPEIALCPSPSFTLRATFEVPVVPPKFYDGIIPSLSGSTAKGKRDTVAYNLYQATPAKREKEMWTECLYKPEYAKWFYEEESAREEREREEAKERRIKQAELEKEKKKQKKKKKKQQGANDGDSSAGNRSDGGSDSSMEVVQAQSRGSF